MFLDRSRRHSRGAGGGGGGGGGDFGVAIGTGLDHLLVVIVMLSAGAYLSYKHTYKLYLKLSIHNKSNEKFCTKPAIRPLFGIPHTILEQCYTNYSEQEFTAPYLNWATTNPSSCHSHTLNIRHQPNSMYRSHSLTSRSCLS